MLFNAAASAIVLGAVASATYAPAEITYTSIDHVTITSCAPEITNCPGKTTPTTYYSVSTCTEESVTPTAPAGYTMMTSSAVPPVYYSTPSASAPMPPVVYSTSSYEVSTVSTSCTESSTMPVYSTAVPPPVYSTAVPPPVYSTAVPPPVYTAPPVSTSVETSTTSTSTTTPAPPVYSMPPPVYTVPTNYTSVPVQPPSYTTSVVTVCPGVNYCYATTSIVPSATAPPTIPSPSVPAVPTTSSVCPGGAYCPPAVTTTPAGNATVPVTPPTYLPPATNMAAASKPAFGGLLAVAIVAFFAL